MINPFPGVRVAGTFEELRPLAAKPGTNRHYHGAIDWSLRTGSIIKAPESGNVFYWWAQRPPSGETGKYRPTWPTAVKDKKGREFPYSNYFLDTYGGLIILEGDSGLVHLFCHEYRNQLFELGIAPKSHWNVHEEKADRRWPLTAMHTLNHPIKVREGQEIGRSGNAGYSMGPHVHNEIHRGWKWNRWEDRPNPLDVYTGKRSGKEHLK